MQWSNNERNFEGIRVEVSLGNKRGETCYEVKVKEAKTRYGTIQLPFTADELNEKMGLSGYFKGYFLDNDNEYVFTRGFKKEKEANEFAKRVEEAIKKLEEEKKGIEKVKKIRRRIEDHLRKSDSETILSVAKQLGVKIE